MQPMTLNRVYLSHGNRKKTTTLGEIMSTAHEREEFFFRVHVVLFSFFSFGDSKYISSSSHFNPPHLTPRARKIGTDAS